MVSGLLNMRKRAMTLAADSPSSPPSSVASLEPGSRRVRALSRFSRLGVSLRRDSFVTPIATDVPPQTPLSPVFSSSRSPTSTFRPLKQIRRQSRSFSAAFSSLFPPSPPTSPPSPTVSVSIANRPRPRFASERKRDGLKRQISYPLLRESFDKLAGRDSWGARDESQRPPTPALALSNSTTSSIREGSHALVQPNEFGTIAFPTTASSSVSSADRSLQADSTHSSIRGPGLSNPLFPPSRFSTSTDESIYSQSSMSSCVWVEMPTTTMTTSSSFEPFAPVREEQSPVCGYSALGLDIRMEGTADVELSRPISPFATNEELMTTPTKASRSYRRSGSTLAWTSEESPAQAAGAEKYADLALPETPKSYPYSPRLALTPPPTPYLEPVQISPLNMDLALTPPSPLPVCHEEPTSVDDNNETQDLTSVSLLSLTLAEMSENLAQLSRGKVEVEDIAPSSCHLPSLRNVPFPSTLESSPPSFLDMDCSSDTASSYDTSCYSAAIETDSPTPLPKQVRSHRSQRLLRRISQRLRPARLSFSSVSSTTSVRRPPPSPLPPLTNRNQLAGKTAVAGETPTGATFPRRVTKSSLSSFFSPFVASQDRKGTI